MPKATRKELVSAIRAALDCYSHFHQPIIQSTDKEFQFGERAAVICCHCVERMERLLEGETHYPFQFVRAKVQEGNGKHYRKRRKGLLEEVRNVSMEEANA